MSPGDLAQLSYEAAAISPTLQDARLAARIEQCPLLRRLLQEEFGDPSPDSHLAAVIAPHLTQIGLLVISQVVFPKSDPKLTSLNTYRDRVQAVEQALYDLHIRGYQLPPGLTDGTPLSPVRMTRNQDGSLLAVALKLCRRPGAADTGCGPVRGGISRRQRADLRCRVLGPDPARLVLYEAEGTPEAEVPTS